jgi:hypothetical protein
MKNIHVYYKAIKQTFSVADGVTEDEMFNTLKRIFRISEPISEFFFQDGDGNILIIPHIIPDELRLNLLVRMSDFKATKTTSKSGDEYFNIETPLQIAARDNKLSEENVRLYLSLCNKEDTLLLPGFNWITAESEKDSLTLENRKYMPLTMPVGTYSGGAMSNVVYSAGKLYFTIKIDVNEYYASFGYVASDFQLNQRVLPPDHLTLGLDYLEGDNVMKIFGVLLDMDRKTMFIFMVNSVYEPTKLLRKFENLPSQVRIYAWIKAGDGFHHFSIIDSSLPIPRILSNNHFR